MNLNNMPQKHISAYVNEEEKKLIVEAGKILGLNQSAFLRTLALKEARKIKNEESNDTTN